MYHASKYQVQPAVISNLLQMHPRMADIGRNFAAGMSGGVAYLWDEDERARPHVNVGMVDLEDLTEAEDIAEANNDRTLLALAIFGLWELHLFQLDLDQAQFDGDRRRRIGPIAENRGVGETLTRLYQVQHHFLALGGVTLRELMRRTL